MAARLESDASAPTSSLNPLLALVAAAPMATAAYDAMGGFVAGNPAWRNLVGEADGAGALPPEDVALCLQGRTKETPPIQLAADDGSRRYIRMAVGPWRGEDGAIAGLIAQAWDVTEEERRRVELERYEERLNAALDIDNIQISEIEAKTGKVFIAGPEDVHALITRKDSPERVQALVSVNDGSEHAPVNYVDDKFVHVHPDDREWVRSVVAKVEADPFAPGPFRLEYRCNSEPPRWMSSISKRFFDADGSIDRIIVVTQDISDRVLKRAQIEELAYTDALTGLPNRAKFQVEFKQAVEAAAAQGSMLGLIMVDVDHFKQINDTLGHDAGDALLQELATHMRQAFRGSDVVARLGGDEFAILLKDVMSEADLARPLAILRQALSTPLHHLGQGLRVMTSIGVAIHDDPAADPANVMKNADIALYKAKGDGRDRVVVFRPEMALQIDEQLALFRDVRAALGRDEFMLYYQPVIDTGQGKVDGFEALMRWNHPQRGILAPVHFAAAFEDPDLSLQLGEIAINATLKQMRQWLDDGVDFGRISINLSASQFRSGHLGRDILARLDEWGVPPERLTVEITENVSMGWGSEAVGKTVRELHERGVSIALDDFGTGYASLANLRQFPIDRLKIDKSFVQNNSDEAIVRAVINLGASMGMQVVAEGVEEHNQLKTLAGFGCDHIQGYHFARPMPAETVSGYLKGFTLQTVDESAA